MIYARRCNTHCALSQAHWQHMSLIADAAPGCCLVQEQYTQTYGVPDAGNNYTSPIIHHVSSLG